MTEKRCYPGGLQSEAGDNRTLRVLVVDIEDDLNGLGVRLAASPAVEFDTAHSCNHALQRLAEDEYAVVLVNLDMAGLAGYETVRSIRGSRSAVVDRSIALVGITCKNVCAREAKDLGLDNCVSMDLTDGELADVLRDCAAEKTAAADNVAIFERENLLNRVGGSAAVLDKIITTFIGSVPEQIAALNEAFAARDVDRVHLLSHTLKGSCANVEALRIRDAAYRIELAAKNGDLSQVGQYLETVRCEFERFIDALRTESE